MPETAQQVRTYAVGDARDEYNRAETYRDWCGEPIPEGFMCSIRTGHEGPQHVAVGGSSDTVVAVKDREQPTPGVGVGDAVHSDAYPMIYAATVLAITENDTDLDGETAAWVVGTVTYHGGSWRLLKRRLNQFTPGFATGYTGDGPTIAQIGEAYVEKHRTLQTHMQATRETLESVRTDYNALTTRHEAFREQVRDLAVEKAKELNWCDPGLNAALEQLGLERKESDWYVNATIRVERSVRLRVTAVSGEAAWQSVDGFSESEVREALEAYQGDDDCGVNWEDWTLEHVDASTRTERVDED
jgi:hypothetical protein